jgi:hypothetical protein
MTKLATVHGKILLEYIGGWFAQPEIEAASASATLADEVGAGILLEVEEPGGASDVTFGSLTEGTMR